MTVQNPQSLLRVCVTCGQPYLPHRSDQLSCSPNCRVRAWRYRQALLGHTPWRKEAKKA